MIPAALRHPPGGKPWLLYLALGLSLAGNVVLVATRPAAAPAPFDDRYAPIGELTATSNAALPPDQVPPLPEPLGVAARPGSLVHSGIVSTSLSGVFVGAPHTSAAALSVVYTRLFAWDLDMRRDIHKGDRVEVLYEQPERGEPVVLAARLTLRPGTPEERILAAYRHHAPGDRFPSYWSAEGQEVPMRLIDGPIADYELVATRVKDRPDHGGMDFKAPIGVPVVAPRAGTVRRVNWDEATSGRSVELAWPDGVLARFLHLNEVLVQPGEKVTAGQVLGKSGNTGRSAGAHLHYELERNGDTVDPMAYHGTLRRRLQAEAMPQFKAAVAELEEQLSRRVAQR